MNEKHYRLIVTDIDGTLVDENQQISATNKDAIRRFQEAGGMFSLATGRVEDAALHYVEQLQIRCPVILYNGGKIVDFTRKETLYEQALLTSEAYDSLIIAEQLNIDMVIYTNDGIWTRRMSDVIDEYMQKDQVRCHVYDDIHDFKDLTVYKILLIRKNEQFEDVVEQLKMNKKMKSRLVRSEPTYLEILPQGVTKGKALAMLASSMNIPLQQVIAIGDNLNDLEMIEQAGWGVAVDNAHQELKGVADYVSRSNIDNGVAEVIERFAFQVGRSLNENRL